VRPVNRIADEQCAQHQSSPACRSITNTAAVPVMRR
jgi:hypothetical protein